MTTQAERYLQAYPDLALRDAAEGIGDPLAHHARTGAAEGRAVPPDLSASLHWSDRVATELMPEAGLLYRLGVIASCRWAACVQLGDAAAAAGDAGSLNRVSELLPDAAVRRVFMEATFDDDRLRLWADDLTPRLRWVDVSALDVAAIRAGLGDAVDVLILLADPGLRGQAFAVAGACVANGETVAVLSSVAPEPPELELEYDGELAPDLERTDVTEKPEPEEAPDGVRLLEGIPIDLVARAIALDHLRPAIVHVFGPVPEESGLAASGRRVFIHVRDRFDLSRVPEHDAATAAFVVDNPRTAIALSQLHGIEPVRVVRLGFPTPPEVSDGAHPTGTFLIVPNEDERVFRINDPGSTDMYGVLHLNDPFADHRLAAAVEAGVPMAVMPGEAARENLGPDGALYVGAAQEEIGDALSKLRDDVLLRNTLADAARAYAWQRQTPARLAEELAALHAKSTP